MRMIPFILGLVFLPVAANAEVPGWLLPMTQDNVPQELLDAVRDADTVGRDVAFPAVPDSAPLIVREGNDGGVCMGCHLPSGFGQPQSAPLAGLPFNYFMRTMADFASGARGTVYRPQMMRFAENLTEAQTREIAEYYAAKRPVSWIEVRETDTVPRTFIGPRDIIAPYPDGGQEPLGERIVEIAKTPLSPYETGSPAYVAYVPPGSLAQGGTLANDGAGKTIACGTCHGANLQGMGDVPGIAGRSALHNARQLFEYRDGSRSGVSAAPMLGVVENLEDADIIAIAAYLASRPAS